MKRAEMVLALVTVLAVGTGCGKSANDKDKLIGTWRGVYGISTIIFEVNDDKTYRFAIGTQFVKGTYKLETTETYTPHLAAPAGLVFVHQEAERSGESLPTSTVWHIQFLEDFKIVLTTDLAKVNKDDGGFMMLKTN